MRKLGLIGGMSWLSTRTYYEHINRQVQVARGKQASAPLLIESLDFTGLVRLSSDEDWERASAVLCASARRLEAAGATALIIGANSMHRVYDAVAASVAVPIIHIAEVVGARMAERKVSRAAVIGSSNVMMEDFYRQRLIAHDVALLPPLAADAATLDRIIYDELLLGKATRQAEREVKSIIVHFEKAGAQAIALGCTELDMIVAVDANVLPIFDGTRIHAEAAARWILGES